MSVFGGEVELEHFPNLRGVARLVKGGFYFHPSDEDLSPGARLRKKLLGSCGSLYTNSENAITAGTLG
jgi:hypothetical protein